MSQPLSDDELIALWEAYEAGEASPKTLAQRFGLSIAALRRLAQTHGWQLPQHAAATRPSSWLNKPCPGLGDCPERAELVARSWVLAQQQIDDIETQFADAEPDAERKPPNPVTQARALGVVVRVLKDLVALDRAARLESATDDPQSSNTSDSLRDELARRLAAIQKGREPQTA